VFNITLVVNQGDTAISNSKIVADTPGPGEEKHTIKFAPSPKMSSYLLAMLVGDFVCREGGVDGIPVRACAPPEKNRDDRVRAGNIARGAEVLQQVLRNQISIRKAGSYRVSRFFRGRYGKRGRDYLSGRGAADRSENRVLRLEATCGQRYRA
jgi:hypothetical protein